MFQEHLRIESRRKSTTHMPLWQATVSACSCVVFFFVSFLVDESLPRPISNKSEGDLARGYSPHYSRMEVFENVSFHDVPIVFMFYSNGCVPPVPFNGFWGVLVMYEHFFFFIFFFLSCEMYILYHSGMTLYRATGVHQRPPYTYVNTFYAKTPPGTPSVGQGDLHLTCITAYLIL